jgi:hypothetical protein
MSHQGKRIKISGKQHFTAEVITPGGLQALLRETEVGRLLTETDSRTGVGLPS